MDAPDLTIRLAVPEDAEGILRIYRPYVEDTVITFDCEVPAVEEFRERITTVLKRHPYLVADTEHGIIGYAYASDFKSRSAYDWSVETSIYVDRDWHGCGVGTALYTALEEWLEAQNVLNLYACITYPNPRSIRFHKTFRYKKVARFRKCGYKKKKWRGVIWMQKTIGRRRRKPKPVLTMDELRILKAPAGQQDTLSETQTAPADAQAVLVDTSTAPSWAQTDPAEAQSAPTDPPAAE